MSIIMHPSEDQVSAAEALRLAGQAAGDAERACGRSLDQLAAAVAVAYKTGVPAADAIRLAGFDLGVGSSHSHLTRLVREVYGLRHAPRASDS
jgi:hypothetical protein